MFEIFRSKEEKLLKEYEPVIAELLLRQIHQAFQEFVGEDTEKMAAFVFRINSTETHGYIFSFIETYCRALLPDDFPINTFEKIYMITVGNVWRILFDYDFMKVIPNMSLSIEGNALNVSDCWSDYVQNEHAPNVKNAQLHGRYDCASLVVYDELPKGLVVILSTTDWNSPPAPERRDIPNETDRIQDPKSHEKDKKFHTILVPDIGDLKGLEIINVLISVGDRIEKDDSLIVIESDIAVMEIPSPVNGVVEKIYVHVGERISQGLPICSVSL